MTPIACKPWIALALEKHLMIGRRHARPGMPPLVAAAAVIALALVLAGPNRTARGAARARPQHQQGFGLELKAAPNGCPFANQIQDAVTMR